MSISDLPDPKRRYALLLKESGELDNAEAVSLKILDGQGVTISPSQYEEKIMDGTHVEVDVVLRLWNNPAGKNNATGSHVYQLILRGMKLLPYHTNTNEALLHHAGIDSKPNTKRMTIDNDDEGDNPKGSLCKRSAFLLDEMDLEE